MAFQWKNKKVVVTGAAGFIGSHLVDRLLEVGANVTALVQYNSLGNWEHLEHYAQQTPRHLKVVLGDVRDAEQMQTLVAGNEIVFNLAALIAIPYSYEAPQSYIDTNVQGTLNILNASRRHGVDRVIQTSTSEVYGTAQYTPIDEHHPLQAQSPYAASKIAADQLALSFYRSFQLPVLVVRPFNTFGPRQSARAVIPTILLNLLERSRILHLGSLKPVRDFTYVTDTVDGFLKSVESGHLGDVVNLGTGKGVSIQELLQLAVKVVGVPKPQVVTDERRLRPSKSEVWKLISSNARARKIFKWKPTVSLEMGLKQTAAYLETAMSTYKSGRYNI